MIPSVQVNLGVLVLLGFLVLAVIRVPIYLSLLIPSVTYIYFTEIPLPLIAQQMVRTTNSFTLLAIPLFLFVGNIMNDAEITDAIFSFARNMVGHLHGGFAQLNIVASLIFSGMSGSALADVGGLGKVLFEAMENEGYDESFAAGLTSASATVGPIFPPSIPIIVYGLVAKVSVLHLLIAGIGPALLIVVCLSIGTELYLRRNPHLKGDSLQSRPPVNDILKSFLKALPALLAPVILIGGMLSGIFGPTETAAVTVLYVFFISLVYYQSLDWQIIWGSAKETVYTSGAVMIIVGAAGVFTYVMALERIGALFGSLIFSVSQDPFVALLFVNLFLLVLGLFIGPTPAIIMAVPIVVGPLTQLGVSPVHLGIIMVFNLMIGLLTPPLGGILFVCKDVTGVPIASIIKGVGPYYIVLLVCLLIVSFYPPITMALPGII